MSWDDDYDGEYANGADGSCGQCGDETDEPWHLLCRSCFAIEQGWKPRRAEQPDPGTAEEVTVVGIAELHGRLRTLEQRVAQLESLTRGLFERKRAA